MKAKNITDNQENKCMSSRNVDLKFKVRNFIDKLKFFYDSASCCGLYYQYRLQSKLHVNLNFANNKVYKVEEEEKVKRKNKYIINWKERRM